MLARILIFGLVVATGLAAAQLRVPTVDLDSLGGMGAVEANLKIETLGQSAVPALRAGLKHPSARVRATCIRHLERLDDTASTPDMVALLRDPDENVCNMAARALVSLRNFDEARALEVLTDPATKDHTRAQLLAALDARRSEAVIPVARDILRRRARCTGESRMAAARVLRREPSEAPLLRSVVRDATERQAIRMRCVLSLGTLQQTEDLVRFANDPALPPQVRAAAVCSMRCNPQEKTLPALKRLLQDETVPLIARLEAAQVLYKLDVDLPIPAFVAPALKDPEKKVRQLAAQVIVNYGGDAALETPLTQAIKDEKDPCVNCEMRKALQVCLQF